MSKIAATIATALAALKGLGEVLKFVGTFTDPDKRRAAYELELDRKARKALEYGEKEFHLVDSFLNGDISQRRLKDFHKRFRTIFFKND